ncbi:MAG: hypothetical protein VYA34_05790 [Myxococcota bacterium]|nr:hypothetical protein [Myxococcota bacterium]
MTVPISQYELRWNSSTLTLSFEEDITTFGKPENKPNTTQNTTSTHLWCNEIETYPKSSITNHSHRVILQAKGPDFPCRTQLRNSLQQLCLEKEFTPVSTPHSSLRTKALTESVASGVTHIGDKIATKISIIEASQAADIEKIPTKILQDFATVEQFLVIISAPLLRAFKLCVETLGIPQEILPIHIRPWSPSLRCTTNAADRIILMDKHHLDEDRLHGWKQWCPKIETWATSWRWEILGLNFPLGLTMNDSSFTWLKRMLGNEFDYNFFEPDGAQPTTTLNACHNLWGQIQIRLNLKYGSASVFTERYHRGVEFLINVFTLSYFGTPFSVINPITDPAQHPYRKGIPT